jgi:hypothetical protein
MAKAAKSGSAKANRESKNTGSDISSENEEDEDDEEELTSDGDPVTSLGGSEASGKSEEPSAEVPEEFVVPEPEKLDDNVRYMFKKTWNGATLNVTVAKMEDQKVLAERVVPFTLEADADKFILNKRNEIRAAKEEKLHQKTLKETEPLPFTPRFGIGVEHSKDDISITCHFNKETVIVPAEISDHVVKWLNGRAVAAWSVSDKGFSVVTYPCGQRQVFVYNNGKVYQSQ